MEEKTFCDPIYPCSEETGQRILRFCEQLAKERNMKEKKTKKMTKAEAFEYLKGTKVKCYERSNALYCGLVEKITTECGCIYNGFMSPPDVSIFAIYIDDAGYIGHLCTVDADKYNEIKCRGISADDILSIEIVEDKYELEFNYDKVVELAKPLMHYLNEVGCQDSIRVSQLGIVHEPMSTLIFDNGIGE